MALADDLLEQARHLVRREVRRPRQASLRRAVSTAYYALFHLLIAEACRKIVVGESADSLRPLLGRAFDHSEMKRASATFSSGNPPPHLQPLLTLPISHDLRLVARTFGELQQARHEADYNVAARFARQDADALVARAERAFEAWQRIRDTADAKIYLFSLLFHSRWNR